jgi:menaquinone-specific isochorismate synthase
MAEVVALRVRTQELAIAEGFDLLDHFPENPVVFVRNGQGLIGSGEALVLEASGENRISELAKKWNDLVSKAEIDDAINIPGTGLIGFGSIAFSPESATKSILVVPNVIVGLRDGRAWVTTITSSSQHPEQQMFPTEKQTYKTNEPVNLNPGQLSPQQFLDSATIAIAQIRAGHLQKVVLARDLTGEVPENFDLRPVLKTLAQDYPSCWVYSVGGLFGASPELLVRVSHRQVSARVLAGTAARGETKEIDQQNAKDLAASSKNISEHKFALDSMVQTLSPFCIKVDAEEVPFSLALPNLWHLASDVYGVLKEDSSVLDLAASLHPTAAVAGTPRDKAQQLISELETFDRKGYAGPVGWIGSDGDGEWAIALRGGHLEAKRVTAFAGCGLVLDSDPESELAETELKFAPVRKALG